MRSETSGTSLSFRRHAKHAIAPISAKVSDAPPIQSGSVIAPCSSGIKYRSDMVVENGVLMEIDANVVVDFVFGFESGEAGF